MFPQSFSGAKMYIIDVFKVEKHITEEIHSSIVHKMLYRKKKQVRS